MKIESILLLSELISTFVTIPRPSPKYTISSSYHAAGMSVLTAVSERWVLSTAGIYCAVYTYQLSCIGKCLRVNKPRARCKLSTANEINGNLIGSRENKMMVAGHITM